MLMQGEALMNVSTGHDTVIYREPLGVFAGIAPFNFPAMIPFGWMLPLCITTGNTFVLKAASLVPLTGHMLLDLLYEAGLPKGVVNMVTGREGSRPRSCSSTRTSGASPSSAPRRSASTSTPSPPPTASACRRRRGQEPRHRAQGRLARALRPRHHQLHLRLRRHALHGPAASCVVENAVADEFIGYLFKFAKERVVGPAYDPKTELGPVVSAEHKKFVTDWIDKAVEEGAELLLDGRDIVVPGYEGGYFVGPTIFDHVTEDMSCGREEVFGPVIFIKRVDDFEEAITIMNHSRFANGSCIFTESGYYAREFVRRTDAGMVGVNVGIPVPVSFFPFTGNKQSFFGDLHVLGSEGLDFYTESQDRHHPLVQRRGQEAEPRSATWEGTVNR